MGNKLSKNDEKLSKTKTNKKKKTAKNSPKRDNSRNVEQQTVAIEKLIELETAQGDSQRTTETNLCSRQQEGRKEDKSVVELKTEHDRMVVAAIDFGTHGSGFALCTKADYEVGHKKIHIHTWKSGTNITSKAPTTVLINPNGKDCVSFGYKAERDYLNMMPEKQKKYYLFRQFKMRLFKNTNLSESTTLKDLTEKELPAVDVFAAVIRFFKESLQTQLNGQMFDPLDEPFGYDDIYWVITVPAIWDLRAKQFMRKAAEKAGLTDSQLSLALEPEAASIDCRRTPVEIGTQTDGVKQVASLQAGSKYLVIDLGGGTIDITAHEVLEDGGLRELRQASGGYYGGTCVNDEIMSFFKRLLGAPVLMALKDNHPGDYLELMNDIERKKCNFKTNSVNVSLKIPVRLMDAYKNEYGFSIKTVSENTEFLEDVDMKLDKLIISKNLFRRFFQTSLDNIVKLIKEILNSPEMSDVNTLLAVGGYVESPLIIETLNSEFPQKRIVIPTDPSLSVLKGAVIYGFEPETITSRVCRYTYGIAKQGIWREGDPESKKLQEKTKGGHHWCDDVFDKHVEVGQVVKIGEFQKPKSYFTVEGQEMALLDFYASKDRNPRFVDDPSCTCVGSFVLDLSGKKSRENISVRIGVGGTELKVEALEENTGRVFKSFCNFLP